MNDYCLPSAGTSDLMSNESPVLFCQTNSRNHCKRSDSVVKKIIRYLVVCLLAISTTWTRSKFTRSILFCRAYSTWHRGTGRKRIDSRGISMFGRSEEGGPFHPLSGWHQHDTITTAQLSKSRPSRSMLYSESPSSSSGPTRNSVKKSKKKKKSFRKSKIEHKGRGNTGPLSMEELTEHVYHKYLHGSGGVFRNLQRKRSRFSRQYGIHVDGKPQQQSSPEPNQSALLIDHPNGDNDDNHNHNVHAAKNPFSTSATNIRNLDKHPVLVLNANYQPLSYLPLSMWHWQEAVKAVFNGKVTVVDVYPNVVVRAATLHVPLPSVIALTEFVSPKALHHKPAFTKRNVFLRDEYRCQYCNDFFHTRDLTLDHVVPRCRGGHLNWENAVTCCSVCNGRKGSLGLKEFKSKWGLTLRTPPRTPSQYELASISSRLVPRKVHPTWDPYLPIDRSSTTETNTEASNPSSTILDSKSSTANIDQAELQLIE